MSVLHSGIGVLRQAHATTFIISVPLVVEATLSDAAVERIVAEVGVDRIWRAIDKLTAPELPLAAAE
jgi:hypothetical protein